MPGLVRGIARTAVVAGTATAVSGRVRRRQQGRWAEQDSAAAPQEAAPPEAAPQQAAPQQDRVAQLKELAALRDSGALTEQEFGAEKARILSS